MVFRHAFRRIADFLMKEGGTKGALSLLGTLGLDSPSLNLLNDGFSILS